MLSSFYTDLLVTVYGVIRIASGTKWNGMLCLGGEGESNPLQFPWRARKEYLFLKSKREKEILCTSFKVFHLICYSTCNILIGELNQPSFTAQVVLYKCGNAGCRSIPFSPF